MKLAIFSGTSQELWDDHRWHRRLLKNLRALWSTSMRLPGDRRTGVIGRAQWRAFKWLLRQTFILDLFDISNTSEYHRISRCNIQLCWWDWSNINIDIAWEHDTLMQGFMMLAVRLYTSAKLRLTWTGPSECPKVEIPSPKASITVCEFINIINMFQI